MMNELEKKVTILVNSSDGFEDCWPPFFTLMQKYWPSNDLKILLNTEFKEYVLEGLKITSSKVHEPFRNRKLTWSECLINALNKIDTPFVLYMQEDYFLEKDVNTNLISDFSSIMIDDERIAYIGLTDIGNKGPFKPYFNDERLWVVGNGKYRISTQAALWRKDVLLSYLKPEENGWMFEIFGTQRAKKRSDLFLTANRTLYNKWHDPIMLYEHTGIIKGKWHHRMPEVFAKNEIVMNFEDRGFYKPKKWFTRKIETARKLLSNPFKFYYGMKGQ